MQTAQNSTDWINREAVWRQTARVEVENERTHSDTHSTRANFKCRNIQIKKLPSQFIEQYQVDSTIVFF